EAAIYRSQKIVIKRPRSNSDHSRASVLPQSEPYRSLAPTTPIPKLEHHQDPHHRTVVTGMDGYIAVEQLVDEFGTNEMARANSGQAVACQLAKPRVCREPDAEGKPKAMLFLGDDLGRQEVL